MSVSSDLDEQRLQFLRSTSIGRISEVDFSDRTDPNNNYDGSETHSNQSESDAAAGGGGGPLPALFENEEEVERARRSSLDNNNNINTSYKPSALPATLSESRKNIFDTSSRVLRKGSSDNHQQQHQQQQQQQQHQQLAATGTTTTSNDEILSIEEQMEMMNNEITNNRIATPDNLSNDDDDNNNPTTTTTSRRDQYRNSYDYHGIGTIMYYITNLKNNIDYDRRKKLRMWYKTNIHPFRKIILSQIGCILYILIVTFSYPPIGMKDPMTGNIIDTSSVVNTENGVILVNGDYRPVVAIGGWQKFCLAMSRMSAFSMYPMLVIVFFTKMKALQTFFAKTPYSMYFSMITEGHDYHVYAGHYIAFDIWVHTGFHLLRWISQGNMELLGTSAAGQTGLITICVTPLITFPMMYFKRRGCGLLRPYEVRKALHYLFYVFALAMCFHVPPSAVPNGGFLPFVLGICIGMYTLDAFYVHIFMCEKIETTAFNVLSTGVRISMPVSDRFMRNAERGSFAYINLPWVNNKQWHPFSLFDDPANPKIQQVFIMKSGDWTKAVHSALARDTTRPVWIKGPFPSPFGHASLYDNQILIASGIGITPALGAINAFKSTRRVNLIWAVRDPEMLEFFMEKMYLEHDGWNLIFYTGKKPLNSDIYNLNTNIKVIKGRPKLPSVIPNIIYGIESKEGLPENFISSDADLQPGFSPVDENKSQEICVKRFNDNVMETWGMMYCGGSPPVIETLQEISMKYHIDVHIDSFAW